jgi:hypothetical protein
MSNYEKIKQTLMAQDVESLKIMIELLNVDYNEGVDLVIEEALNALESKIDEASFVAFCDSL